MSNDRFVPTKDAMEGAKVATHIAITACQGCGQIHVYLCDSDGMVIALVSLEPESYFDAIEAVDQQMDADELEDAKGRPN